MACGNRACQKDYALFSSRIQAPTRINDVMTWDDNAQLAGTPRPRAFTDHSPLT